MPRWRSVRSGKRLTAMAFREDEFAKKRVKPKKKRKKAEKR